MVFVLSITFVLHRHEVVHSMTISTRGGTGRSTTSTATSTTSATSLTSACTATSASSLTSASFTFRARSAKGVLRSHAVSAATDAKGRKPLTCGRAGLQELLVRREVREAIRLGVHIEALHAAPWSMNAAGTRSRLGEDVEAGGEGHWIRLGEEVPVLVSAMAAHLVVARWW